MWFAWALIGCGADMTVEQGPTVVCEEPGRREDQLFDRKLQPPERRLDRADLHGGGLLIEDLDGDGWFDLFAPGETEHILRWGRDGSLERPFDIGDAGLEGLPLDFAVGATAIDVEGDGDLDIYVTRWERPNTLLVNVGDRRFIDGTAEAFPGAVGAKSQSASWGDIDADGDLDLFVGTYGERAVIDVNASEADCSDHIPDRAQLWRNQGDGTFVDVSDRLPQAAHAYTFMSGFFDLDDDGFPELVLAHDDGRCGPSVLLDNDGGTLKVAVGSGFERGAHDMGMGVGDLNGDEVPDFLFSSWNGNSLMQSRVRNGAVEWIEFANAVGLRPDIPDRPAQAVDGQQIYGWGAELGDLDNDADLDAVVLFGFWSYYTGAGNKVRQRDGLWFQAADGSFTDEAGAHGLDEEGVSRGVVLADIDNDGYLDVVKHSLDEGIPLHLSRCGTAAWTRIRLQDEGPNRFGVGARVRVRAGGRTQVRWVTSGSRGMYTGAPLEAHIGLGDAERIDRVDVVWPDGQVTTVRDLPVRQRLTLRRGAG